MKGLNGSAFVYISYKAYLNMVGGRWKWGTAPSISHENHGEERQIGGKGVRERERASVLSCYPNDKTNETADQYQLSLL